MCVIYRGRRRRCKLHPLGLESAPGFKSTKVQPNERETCSFNLNPAFNLNPGAFLSPRESACTLSSLRCGAVSSSQRERPRVPRSRRRRRRRRWGHTWRRRITLSPRHPLATPRHQTRFRPLASRVKIVHIDVASMMRQLYMLTCQA